MDRKLSQYFRKIGKKGGKARLETLTPEQRSAIGKKAAAARWNKPGAKQPIDKPTESGAS